MQREHLQLRPWLRPVPISGPVLSDLYGELQSQPSSIWEVYEGSTPSYQVSAIELKGKTYPQVGCLRLHVAFCVQNKLSQAGENPSVHLLILRPNGSFFCSCGYPARNDLVCRHFFACYATPELQSVWFNIPLCPHERWWVDDDLQGRESWERLSIYKYPNAETPPFGFTAAVSARRSPWGASQFHPAQLSRSSAQAEGLLALLTNISRQRRRDTKKRTPNVSSRTI